MPIVSNIKLNFNMEQVLRRQGIMQHYKPRPQIMGILHELMDTVNKSHLLKPEIVYKIHSITDMVQNRIYLSGNESLHSPFLTSTITSAKEIAVIVCTIGPKLEEKAAQFFHQDEPLRGLLLDGIGSAAVDSLSREACQILAKDASTRGYQTSSPISPGMFGLPISEQQHLFELVPAEEIGVHLTPAQIMVPCKSVSMVIGIGPEMATWTKAEVCRRCKLKKNCRYKVLKSTKEDSYL
jgi:cobalamin-dependent methionine synthase I